MPSKNSYYEKISDIIGNIRNFLNSVKNSQLDIIDIEPYNINITLNNKYKNKCHNIYIKFNYGFPIEKPFILIENLKGKKEHGFHWNKNDDILEHIKLILKNIKQENKTMLDSFGTGRYLIPWYETPSDDHNNNIEIDRFKEYIEEQLRDRGLDSSKFMSDVKYISNRVNKNYRIIVDTMFKNDCDVEKTIQDLSRY